MSWEGHPRTTTPTWRKTRARILKRDHGICHVCGQPGADEVDHVIPDFEGGPSTIDNLAPIHDDPCHRRKSSAEGLRARWQRSARKRPTEQHPGLR